MMMHGLANFKRDSTCAAGFFSEISVNSLFHKNPSPDT